MQIEARVRASITGLLLGTAGIAVGFFVIAAAHRASHTLSRWALAKGLIELYGSWLLPRFIAWSCVASIAGLTLGFFLRQRYLAPSVLAAITVPTTYVVAFLYLFEADGLTLVRSYWFESVVVLLFLPATAWAISKRTGS